MSKRSSPIWKISKEELIEVVNKSISITEVLKHFGLLNKGGNFKTLKKRFIEDNIDFSCLNFWNHHKRGSEGGGKFGGLTPMSLNSLLTENSLYNRTNLKKRLLKLGILKNICYICGQLPEWNNKPLSLQLDHINGVSDDNRLENLRILCPHCHSQTDTFAGRSLRKKPEDKKPRPVWIHKPRKSKINWPNDLDLIELVKSTNFCSAARKLGITDNAIRRRMKLRNILHLVYIEH